MKTYYEMLNLKPKATAVEVDASFRKLMARYRITLTTDQLVQDGRFHDYLNAYLTLHGPSRAQYDEAMRTSAGKELPQPTPWVKLTPAEQRTMLARIAFWRREMAETLHMLRELLGKEPGHAPAWALLGEVNLTIDRLEEGIQAYDRAVALDPGNAGYANRLKHVKDAAAGKVHLKIEASPEEELLREERRKRLRITVSLGLIALAVMAAAFIVPSRQDPASLNVPWRTVGIQSAGVFILMLAFGFGRFLQPFEKVMVWTSISAGDRGSMRKYPYLLILFVTCAASLWLGIAAFVITAIMNEEWPPSATCMLAACAVLNAVLVLLQYYVFHDPWISTLLFGGNPLALAAMLGWWFGSIGTPTYD